MLTRGSGHPDADSRPDSPAAAPPHAYRPPLNALPYLLAVAGLVAGLAWMWVDPRQVQAGTVVVASALVLAAVERLVLPERQAGLLVSRRRVTDVLILGGLGAGIMVIALVLPTAA